ncbi:hypothetical protein EC957_001470 [Mortierella hygrophila]|uniref:Uncharacterized protein n=1 Tax=Mortierella hygrophila TaxID=979708 RepID=A0A9P6F645_9FUNG|nr:hypothetical protein EC957_001470 [Mortierella hygrophila]
MPPRHIANTPVKVNAAFSSPSSVAVAPLTTSIAGLTSVRNIFGTAPARRHTVGQMPSTHFSPRLPINPPASAGHHNHHQRNQPSVSSFISAGGAMIGIDSGPRKTAAEKAAERDWQEQARQIFQLSTVSAKGHFLPPSPSPLELGKQGSNDRFKDNDTDYFTTIIISTSPERVRTFLSTESSISPGMFSLPANKIKRNAIPSFSTPPSSSSSLLSSSASLSSPSSSELSSTRPSSPASMSQQRHLSQQQQTLAVVVGQDKESSKVAATPSNLPPPYVSAVAIPVVAGIPAAIPKRRVVAPADTLSTPPSSPPAISAKDMYFPTSDPTATSTAATQSIPVTPPSSTPKSMPSTPSSQSYSSNSSNNPRQRLRRPHQESPMHRNSRVAEEEQDEDEDEVDGGGGGRGGRGSNRNKVMSKRQAQISFLTGVTSEDEEDLSDIFAHTVYNTNSNNSSNRRKHYGSSSFLTSSPPA